MNIDEFIEHTKEKAEEYKYRASFFESDNPMNKACIKVAKDHEQLAEWLEKSKEYQQLEEQGRLIKLPCKVGDKVYRIRKKESVIEMRVLQIYCRKNCDGKTRIWFDTIHIDNNEFENSYFVEDIGKTVFLTKSEAEAKLKELRGREE